MKCGNPAHILRIVGPDGKVTVRGCFKYKTIEGYGGLLATSVFLHAWATHGRSCVSHDTHKYVEPLPEQLEASQLLFPR